MKEDKNSPENISSILCVIKGKGHCPQCGMGVLPPNSNYCWNCGEKLNIKKSNTNHISLSVPIDEFWTEHLIKLMATNLEDIGEEYDYEGFYAALDLCKELAEHGHVAPQLLKKCASACTKMDEYDQAINFYELMMDADPYLDLTPQIRRLEKKIYGY